MTVFTDKPAIVVSVMFDEIVYVPRNRLFATLRIVAYDRPTHANLLFW